VAVYTHVSDDEIARFIACYDIGRFVAAVPIEEGVENTNYRIETVSGRFILTLFEKRVRAEDLPFFIALMRHLSQRGVPAPAPIAARDGATLMRLADRPAALVSFLNGAARMQPDPEDCRAAGAALANLHAAGADFGMLRSNDLGLDGWRKLAAACRGRANECAAGLAELIDAELALLESNWPRALPAGAIHADLFPDNVFFDADKVSGVIDFYFSCTDFLGYDIAVATNAWASQGGRWSQANATAILSGYEEVRPLGAEERNAIPVLLRGAALRFLLTRLYDWLHQVPGAVVRVKDPLEYRDLLIRHRGTLRD